MKKKELAEIRARLQKFCEELQTGRYEILSEGDLVDGLANPLASLVKSGEVTILDDLIGAVAVCCHHDDERIRFQGVKVLAGILPSRHINKLSPSQLRAVAQAFSGWLKGEQSLRPDGCEILSALLVLIDRLVILRLWGVVELLLRSAYQSCVETLSDTPAYVVPPPLRFSPDAIRKIIALLVAAFARARATDREQIKTLLRIPADEAILPLIEELLKHPEKEVRIALFEVIPRKTNIIVPGILKRFAVKQPWYILRNAILILALVNDSGLFCLVKPFLKHPDHRVQKAVIDFIALVGSDEIQSDLIDAILVVDDRLLPGLVLLLQQHGGEEVEMAFFAMLSDRYQIVSSVRDEVVIRLCESGMLPISQKSLDILGQIVSEEEYGNVSDSQVAQAARKASVYIQRRLKPDSDE